MKFMVPFVCYGLKTVWERRIGYPTTDETSMNTDDNGRFSRFEHGVIGWTPTGGAWFDFTRGAGDFSGRIRLYKNSNFSSTNHRYNVSNARPILFKNDLTREGLHDNVSSLRFDGIPNTCSIYLFQHSNFDGRYLKITGKPNGEQHSISYIGNHLNDKVSSIRVENHGTASVLISQQELEALAASEVGSINVDGVDWKGSPKVGIDIAQRALYITINGVIEQTWPDSDIKINIFFRPYVAGPRTVKFSFLKWHATTGGSFFGYANSTILGKVRNYFKNNGASLADKLNTAMASELNDLDQVPDFAKDEINVRRVNILPEGLEIVLSDSSLGALLLDAANISRVNTDRPNQVTLSPRSI